MDTRRDIWGPLLALTALVLAWEGLRHSAWFDPQFLPSATRIGEAFVEQLQRVRFWRDWIETMYRALAGLAAALLVGVAAGLIIGSGRWLRYAGVPLVDFLRSIPVTTLYPVFVLTLGIGNRGKIGMVFLGCVSVIALHTATGFDKRSRVRHAIARLYGASRIQLMLRVSIWEVVPSILTGLRIAVGLALIIATLTEMFMGASRGMGQTLMEWYSVYNLPAMYAYIAGLGITGFALNRACVALESRALKWTVR